MGSQLLQENAVGDSIRDFTQSSRHIQSLSLIHQMGNPVMKVDQVGQAGPGFPEPLAGPDPLVLYCVVTLEVISSITFPTLRSS